VSHIDFVYSTKPARTGYEHADITNGFYQGFPQKIDLIISRSAPDFRFLFVAVTIASNKKNVQALQRGCHQTIAPVLTLSITSIE
jgi:hypothetical protein